MVNDLTATCSAPATRQDGVLRHVDDWPWLNSLSCTRREALLARLASVLAVAGAPRGQGQCIAAAAAARHSVSRATIHRWLRAWRANGIKALVDLRGHHSSPLPPKFISHVRGLFDPHQRADDGAEVHRRLLADLALWERTGNPSHAIPGYTAPPPRDPKTGLPQGWSYARLIARCKPRGFTAAATKLGPKAASAFLPPVLTTRVGSAVLSRILFDDQKLDNLLADGTLALAGLPETHCPVSFNSLDFFTGYHLRQHLRAVWRDPDSGKNKTLTGREFTWFVIAGLQDHGYRTDAIGTQLVFEWGTANAWGGASSALTSLGGRHSFDDAVHAVSGGHVSVARSGRFNSPIFAGLCFRPESSGNFRFKTWLESAFRLLRTWMQALPGPTGSNSRQNKPEEQAGIIARERQLLAAIATQLDPHHAALVRHHLLSLPQYHELICAVYRAVNRRTDHDLEGWAQCGFTYQVWRPSVPAPGQPDTWFTGEDLDRLDPASRQLMLARINANRDALTRTRRLSPEGAFTASLARESCIRKLGDDLVGLLLPMDWAITRTVGQDRTITLPNPLWPDTADTYVCKFQDRGRTWLLEPRQRLLVFHNPFLDGRAHLHHPDGHYLGTVHPVVRARPFDHDAYLLQLKTRSTIESAEITEIKSRMADVAADRSARENHNSRLLAGAPVTPEELAAARSAAGRQAHRTAAANRLHSHGTPIDWDAQPSPAQTPSAWDSLPDDDPLPDAF